VSQPLPLKDQLKALEHIQELDLKIDSLKNNKGSLPAALKALDDKLAKLSVSVIAKKAALNEIDKTQRQTQAAIDLNRDRQSRSGARMEGVQNSQEYSAANKEVDQLKKQKDGLDEQMKKSQGDIDVVNKGLGDLNDQMSKFKEERDAQATLLTGQTDKIEGEIKNLQGERSKLTAKVDPRTMAQYDRVRPARAGLGIVPAIAGRCKGCNMMVPAQQFNEIQRGNTLHSCPSCHRILFIPTSGGTDAGTGTEAAKV
jgi:predicted  nucleic acid-binding Zn-ribbon protein